MYARTSAVALALLLVVAGLASAQATTGAITGRITDAQGLAIPGATVTLTGPQGARTVATDNDGNYTAPFLVPGTYSVRAELQGFKAAETKNVLVSLGQTTSVNLNLEIGGLAETVEVTGASSIVDTRSTTTGGVISSDMLARIPIGRRMTDALYIAPGVSSGGTVGNANPSISGSSGLDNQYVVDGVNVTNTGYGAIGSYSIIFGSLGTATPFDFIKEVQVKTGGYEAEFGQSLGGIVNVVTKSGSNQLRGSVFGYARPDQLESNWKTFQSVNGTVNTVATRNSDVGVEGGFPILRDRLFGFAAYNPSWETRTMIAPDGFPLQSLGDVDRDRHTNSYSAKATWQASSAHRVDASFFGDPSEGDNGPQRTTSLTVQDTSSFSSIDYGGHNQTVHYDGVFGSNWLVEASYGRAYNKINETPSVNTWRVTDTRVVPQIITGGIGFFEQGNKGTNNQYQIKATNVWRGHQFRYGFLFEDVSYSQINQRTGPTFIANGERTATGAQVSILADDFFGQIYRVTRANYVAARDTNQHYKSFFVQDSWRVGDRLTVNAGVRYEDQTLVGTVNELTTLDGRTIDDFSLKNNWAPRVGAVYDILGNGRSKLYANYGRFFARIPNDLAARALSADAGISRADYFDANLTQQIPDGVATQQPGQGEITQHFLVAGTATDLIDTNSKLSYKDEWVGGFEYQAFTNTSVGVRYIHRNIGRILEDVTPFSAVACDFGVEEACNTNYVLTNPDRNTPVIQVPGMPAASYEDPVHTYNAVEFTADRRFSNRWSLQGSYRWSRLRGTYEGFYRDDNGQSDPGITSLYDFPTNDPAYTEIGGTEFGYRGDIRFLGKLGEGPLPLDRTHNVKVFGNYQFAMGLNIGVGLNLSSGKPLTSLAALPIYDNDSEIPTTPRGAGFLTTTDGFKSRTPWESTVNLQAAYAVPVGANRRITLIADAFNLFNTRHALDYNAAVEFPGFGVVNPDFGTPTSAIIAGQTYQAPFSLRLGARFEF